MLNMEADGGSAVKLKPPIKSTDENIEFNVTNFSDKDVHKDSVVGDEGLDEHDDDEEKQMISNDDDDQKTNNEKDETTSEQCHSTDNNNTDHDLEEQQHFFDILNTFRHYRSAMNRRIDQSEQCLRSMCERHRAKLSAYGDHLSRLRLAVAHNHEVIKVMVADVANMFRNETYLRQDGKGLVVKAERHLDTDRINSVLNQVVREWSTVGQLERATCFDPILEALDRHLGGLDVDQQARSELRVLCPGAGLGRLPYEIAARGYSCQGNEFSLMMLFVANFVLNKCHTPHSLTLYPWVSQFSSNLESSHQLAAVTFPDVNPESIPPEVDFSMVAGSFTEIFSEDREEKAQFDSVVTCYFLDTAPNVVDYIETIARLLPVGGVWINFGPLLYHYADMPEPSVEPSYEIVRHCITASGFEFVEERTNLTSYYTRNPNSMLAYEYKSVFFVCRKLAAQT